jgi:hypothetical protein
MLAMAFHGFHVAARSFAPHWERRCRPDLEAGEELAFGGARSACRGGSPQI